MATLREVIAWVAANPSALAKYVGLMATFVYGVYATVVDFHVEVDGKKRLSRAGRVGLVLLALGGVVGLAVEGFRDADDAARERTDAARRDSTTARDRAQYESLLGQQQAVLAQLGEQLASLRALDATAHRSERLADAQLAQQRTLLVQQGRLVAEQQIVAFNGVRLLQPLPRVARVDATLEAAWDTAAPYASADLESPRAYAELARAIVDTVCRAWRAIPGSDAPAGAERALGDGLFWRPARDAPTGGRRDLRLEHGVLDAYGVVVRPDGSCAADSLHLGYGSPFLRLHPERGYRRQPPPDLGDQHLAVRIRTGAARTPLLTLGIDVSADTLAAVRGSRLLAFAADFAHGRLRWEVHGAPVTEADTAVDGQLSLLDLPGGRLSVDSRREGSRVSHLVLRFERGRTLTLAARDFVRGADGAPAYEITPRDIERTPGEFAALFAARRAVLPVGAAVTPSITAPSAVGPRVRPRAPAPAIAIARPTPGPVPPSVAPPAP